MAEVSWFPEIVGIKCSMKSKVSGDNLTFFFFFQNTCTVGCFQNCLSSYQGPFVQSTVDLTSSLKGPLVQCFTTL